MLDDSHFKDDDYDPMSDARENAKKIKERQQEKELQQKRLEFDKKINALAEKAVDFSLAYGEDDYRTQMLVTFLDVSLQMKDITDLLDGVQVALNCIQEAVGFIDGIMNLNVQMQEGMLETSYGLFARIKRHRRMRKVVKNNRNRIKETVNQMVAYVNMANDMTIGLKKASVRMQAMLGKGNAKFSKKGSKAQVDTEKSAAKKLIEEVMKKRQGSGEDATGTSGTSGATGGTPKDTKTPPSGGISDISDIV